VSYAGVASTIAIVVAVALILWSCFSTWNDGDGEEIDPTTTAMVNTDTSFIQAFSAATAAVFAFGKTKGFKDKSRAKRFWNMIN
jgi:hypothetical protein